MRHDFWQISHPHHFARIFSNVRFLTRCVTNVKICFAFEILNAPLKCSYLEATTAVPVSQWLPPLTLNMGVLWSSPMLGHYEFFKFYRHCQKSDGRQILLWNFDCCHLFGIFQLNFGTYVQNRDCLPLKPWLIRKHSLCMSMWLNFLHHWVFMCGIRDQVLQCKILSSLLIVSLMESKPSFELLTALKLNVTFPDSCIFN